MSIARNQASLGQSGPVMPNLDYILIVATLALLGFGLVMVASASMHKISSAPFLFVNRHLIAITIGILGAFVIYRIPMVWWERSGISLFFIGLLLLALVLIPWLGKEVNGAQRWIPIGPFSLQTSEFMKLFLVIYFSSYLVRRQAEVTMSSWGVIKPLMLLAVAIFLLMAQPDFGTTVVLAAIALGLLFLGGVPLWHFGLLLVTAASAAAVAVALSPYRVRRVIAFLDPWADVEATGYQLAQALIAFGRGEWIGVGLGNGIQKQFYLPEAHTDFLMAVVGEEFGLVGTLVVIALFAVVVWRAFVIGVGAERRGHQFNAYVAQGFGLWIGMQAFINIGVNVGLLPTKGLTLPLMSYGSNSIIVACWVIAILIRIGYENRRPDDDHEGGQWLA